MYHKPKALLIGGAGFIGSYLTKKLIDNNYEVVVIDAYEVASSISNENLEKVFDYRSKKLHSNAIFHTSYFEAIGERIWSDYQPDVVFHLAALPLEGMEDEYFERKQIITDTALTYMVAKLSQKHDTRLVYMSSLFAYGETPNIVYEDHPLNPKTAYGIDKATGESIIKTISPNWNIIRTAGVYGFGDANMRATQVFLQKAMDGESFWVNDKAMIDFIYIKDLVDGLYQIVESDMVNEVYHISGGYSRPLLDFALEIEKYYSLDYTLKTLGDRPTFATMSNTKARQQLGWSPKYTLEDGVAEYVKLARRYNHA